jgi:predicted transcriptional regulator
MGIRIPLPVSPQSALGIEGMTEVGAVWYTFNMTTKILQDALKQVETWPVEVQEELAVIAREMDAALKGGVYHATPEELAGIDRGLGDARAGRFATDADVASVFAKYRPT